MIPFMNWFFGILILLLGVRTFSQCFTDIRSIVGGTIFLFLSCSLSILLIPVFKAKFEKIIGIKINPLYKGLSIIVLLSMLSLVTPESSSDNENIETTEKNNIHILNSEEIKGFITQVFKNNPEELRSVVVQKSTGNNYIIDVCFNARDNLTKSFIKRGIQDTMAEIYYSSYHNTLMISEITIDAYLPLKDKYGYSSIESVYRTKLNVTEASRINWNEDKYDLTRSVIPGLWTTDFIHPALN